MVAKALTIAGSDSGGGAGIQADLKAFSANGVFGTSALTAITAQNTMGVTAVHPIPVDVVGAQIEAVLTDIRPDAIKIGMLFSPELIETVAKALADYDGPVVLDPVMIAKSGDALLQDEAVDALKSIILPRADLLTPNLPEAARILETSEAATEADALSQAEALRALGPKAILMKGGHAEGDTCTDLLLTKAGSHEFSATRINTRNTHGTGCTYSSTIAANLAKGVDMVTAVETAHSYLHAAIKAADDIDIGAGHGPVHHFHGMWS
ncbi:hydroxymethylpyrimidine kinase /phosphomethylpyrimidine kinase [Cognatiyoonia sediminum]|uniref:hydroxymethylpyrimidine kinase n=1 Tax=Cognatiyoonia sediminum TaxID=1508389 RepID=A0A1M5QWR7_9RHOB|nr:bifunctional hydroxymethylpyrimidine kinase/phosphomethylpyrimidine kinase [Cognatiyoonia sediminum]SHH18003.1 hydroxymethylpyrimidine kinase /phosphomethylpyrimidine kinase [Cognatiyoonia sediminum]